MDDEGNPTHETVLIEKGVLQGYLQDRLSSKLMKSPVTGNGRRQGYDHIPMPRMTNTFMMAGESAPEDIIKSVKKRSVCRSFRRRPGGHHQRQVCLFGKRSVFD